MVLLNNCLSVRIEISPTRRAMITKKCFALKNNPTSSTNKYWLCSWPYLSSYFLNKLWTFKNSVICTNKQYYNTYSITENKSGINHFHLFLIWNLANTQKRKYQFLSLLLNNLHNWVFVAQLCTKLFLDTRFIFLQSWQYLLRFFKSVARLSNHGVARLKYVTNWRTI